ncbi:glycerophosphodiester phosphodiesterase family protein [Paenibacillus sp. J5C_2022]|uniref:glycerophosphodiester phosphodiesterase family protein n=1 Tax=Paenibacillus sp. J5C2022 TaxID=2977129 RepID=UPI0021CFCC2A|nr:glycerophosphodiester phosphodiesterase family protein [Paenibacillus sp. J5C2022]MCU6708106.1 glycerophosphodiester phosphodiesterase family protein [Paenibacillus sp. J5C2022]
MNIAYIQPPYPHLDKMNPLDSVRYMLDQALQVQEDTDLLVLPEYANCPGLDSYDQLLQFIKRESRDFLAELSGIAKDKRMHIAGNIVRLTEAGLRNTTVWIDRKGKVAAEYDKTHLTEFERGTLRLVPGDTVRHVVIEGIRVSFATCFELYFPEFFERLAAGRPDIIIVPTYQRSERSEVLTAQAISRALDSGSYLLRCSYSMGATSEAGGMSMLVHPRGEVLSCAEQEVGIFHTKVNIKDKWWRPSSYGGGVLNSREIIERNRRSELYRNAGPGIGKLAVKSPALIAHRGFSANCPENTMPAFGAAIALGVDEIEFDIRCSKDGELIVIHDATLERTTNATGLVSDYSWAELQRYDAGSSFSPAWQGTKLPLLDHVLEQYAGRIIMNVHVKDAGEDGYVIKRIRALADQYDAAASIYIAGDRDVLEYALQHAPNIERCCLVEQASWNLVDHAIQYECGRLQFFPAYCNEEEVQRAHAAGIRCNLFYSDNPEETRRLFHIGIDAVLTNNPLHTVEE